MATKKGKKVELKNIDAMSFAKVMTIISAILGLVVGIIFAIISFGFSYMGMMYGGYGALSIVVFPILYAILGFLFGLVSALLYNIVAKWVGGVKIEVDR